MSEGEVKMGEGVCLGGIVKSMLRVGSRLTLSQCNWNCCPEICTNSQLERKRSRLL
jgi:hypothetical protein